MGDTARAIETFTNLAINSPRNQFWDLNLPYEVQAVWESVRGEWGPDLTIDQVWQDKWLPPPIFERGASKNDYKLRKMYHDNCILYGLAREKDPEPFIRILHNIEDQKDPAFVLMRVDAMLRLGYGPRRKDAEFSNFSSPSSIVVKAYYLVTWRTQLGSRVTQLAAGIDKKEDPKKGLFSLPNLKIIPRDKN